MPIIKSAKKRVRVARKATVRNAKTKRSLKAALKLFSASTGTKKADARKQAQSNLDKAAKKGLMHKNKVARKQRQLAAAAKAAGIKPAASAKKSAAKKPAAAKKTPAKKPASKK
jgi:small subunit ribosomal protein S20